MLIISEKQRGHKKEAPESEPSRSYEPQTPGKQKLIKNINRTRRDLQMSPWAAGISSDDGFLAGKHGVWVFRFSSGLVGL